MTSGLACDDNDPHSPGDEDRMYAQTWQPDYYRYALNLPMTREFADAHGYGYTWHIFGPKVGGRTQREFMAQGNGGQLIVVLPDLDATVLFLSANYNNYPTWRSYYNDLVPRYIIPAMNGESRS